MKTRICNLAIGLFLLTSINCQEKIDLSDSAIIKEIVNSTPINRLDKFEKYINTDIRCHGTITAITESSAFDRKFIISCIFYNKHLNLRYIFNLHTSNEIISKMTIGRKISFMGRLVLVTPVDAERRRFIFDIILNSATIEAQ